MNVCPTNAPFCGLLPFATNSCALMLLFFAFWAPIAMTTAARRLIVNLLMRVSSLADDLE
jgi:hypothetical protein